MSVTFHTDVGDIKVEVFVEEVPKTAGNIVYHSLFTFFNNHNFLLPNK